MLQNKEGWKLKSLNINLQDWGDYKGKYIAKVKFENAAEEAFMFALSPEETQEYLQLVAGKLVVSAGELGQKLLQSLNHLLPAVPVEEQQPLITIHANQE